MKRPPTETQLESACNRLVTARGGMWRKLDTGLGGKGWPDQAYWLPGRHLIVEFKVDLNEPSAMQARRLEKLKELGHEVHVVRSVAEFEQILAAAPGSEIG